MTINRRRYERTAVSWPVRVWVDDGMVPGMTEDVSPYGVCIITARAITVKMGHSYRVDVLAGFDSPRSIVGQARYAGPHGRIGFETRWRWEPRRGPLTGDATSPSSSAP